MGTRTTGYNISTTDEQLEKTSAEMKIVEGGKNYKPITPFDINTTISKIFEDSQKREGGLQFSASTEIGSPLVAFKRKHFERTGGDDSQKLPNDSRPDEITTTGLWSHSGNGNSKYHARIPIEIMKLDGENWTPEIYAGGTGSYVLNVSGSTDQTKKLKAWVSIMVGRCMNGMESEIVISDDMISQHRNTKGLDVRNVLTEAIRISASNYHKYNMVTDQLKNSYVNPEKLGMFFHSAVMNDQINGGNVKEITNYFWDHSNKYDSWFDNSDLSGYRLYNACTLWGEKQNAIDKREKLSRGIWWSLADSGILPLPETCSYPGSFSPIRQNEREIIDADVLETA